MTYAAARSLRLATNHVPNQRATVLRRRVPSNTGKTSLPMQRHSCRFSSKSKNARISQKRRILMDKMSARITRLREEMQEIDEEQKWIKQGQKQVREKIEAVKSQCQQLRRETMVANEQSANTQLRLLLMFQILRAREANDLSTATQLTRALRELIAKSRTIKSEL